MIDTSSLTNFAPFYRRSGQLCDTIVKLTDGSSTWYLSTVDMQLGDTHVLPLLVSHSGMSSSVDIFTKNWSVNDVTFVFQNVKYRTASGVWVPLIDDIKDIINNDVTVYIACGPNLTAISDCMVRFTGECLEHPKYDSEHITVRAVDKSKLLNRIIPTTSVVSTYTTCPKEIQQEPVPLVYGTFDFDIDDPFSGNGMAKGLPTTRGRFPEFVFSDHVLNAITDLWSSLIGKYPAEYPAHTLTADDSGHGTGQPSGSDYYLWAYFSPTGTELYDYNLSGRTAPTNPANAYDNDATSYAMGQDYFDDSTDFATEPLFSFDDEDENTIISVIERQVDVGNDPASDGNWAKVRYLANPNYAINDSTDEAWVMLYYEKDGAADDYAWNAPVGGGGFLLSFSDTVFYEQAIGSSSYTHGDKNRRYLIGIHLISYSHASANGSTYDANMLKMYDIKLVLRYWLGEGVENENIITPSGNPDETVAWAVCEGREFGSWITESGRSVGGFSSGDLIEDPAFIVESLLRDELGMATADIDTDSFDAAYNSSVTARANVTERVYAYDLIRQLCEQSTFAFSFSANSQARLIPLNESSPTTDRTIHYSEIVNGHIEVSQTPVFTNDVDLSSRWLGEFDTYQDNENVTNSTSKTNYGTRRYRAEWPNINGTSKDHVKAHLVTNSDGLWSQPHVKIKLATAGFLNCDLEVGDWIELDDTSVDPHIECYGTSWSGKQFLVTAVTQEQDMTTIEAVEL